VILRRTGSGVAMNFIQIFQTCPIFLSRSEHEATATWEVINRQAFFTGFVKISLVTLVVVGGPDPRKLWPATPEKEDVPFKKQLSRGIKREQNISKE